MRGQTDCPNTRGYFFFLLVFFSSFFLFSFFPLLSWTRPRPLAHPKLIRCFHRGRCVEGRVFNFGLPARKSIKKRFFFPHQRCLVIWTFSSAPATHTHTHSHSHSTCVAHSPSHLPKRNRGPSSQTDGWPQGSDSESPGKREKKEFQVPGTDEPTTAAPTPILLYSSAVGSAIGIEFAYLPA